jgi:mycofactocin precursor
MHLISLQDRAASTPGEHVRPSLPGREDAIMDTSTDHDVRDQATTADDGAEELALADSLVEEVSIDGMCGVY